MSKKRKASHISLPEGEKRPRKKYMRPREKERHMVSDHALVRYLQRVLGVDVETIRASILSDEHVAMIRELRSISRLPLGPGVSARVRDGVVTTII